MNDGTTFLEAVFFSIFFFAFPKGAFFILSLSLLRERKYGKERGVRGIPISPGPSSESKLPKRSLAQQDFLFWRFVPPLAMQTAGWVCIAETALVFLDLSRVAWKSNANPYCITSFVGSTDFLQ